MVSTFACRTVLFRHCIIHRSSWVIVTHPYRVHSSIQTAIERRISSGCLPPPFFLFMEIRHKWWIWQPAVVSTDWLSRSILYLLFNWLVLLLLLFFYRECLFSPTRLRFIVSNTAISLVSRSWLASHEWLSHVLYTHNVCAGRRTTWHIFQAKHLSFCVISWSSW